jgi:hypothetical protein
MKKLSFAVSVIGIAVFCIGASIWEGSAAVGIGGELPESGYYVATKSFPRNTVVDITNLESGKSVRAIVAAGLDSPGLLAILSREAAALIGIQSRSIGRVRMTMPQDPVAFSRFTEGYNPSGDPDYDPQALIAAAAPRTGSQTPTVSAVTAEPLIPAETFPESVIPPVLENADLTTFAAEQPWANESSAVSLNDAILPGSEGVIPADTPDPVENVQWPWETAMAASVSPSVSPTLPAEQPADLPYVFPEYNWQPPVASREDSAIVPERGAESVPLAEPTVPLTGPTEPAAVPNIPSQSAITLVPAELRPPEPYTEFPPAVEVAPVGSPPAPRTLTWDDIPEDQFIAGIPERTAAQAPEPAVQPAVRPAVTPVEEITRAEPEILSNEEPVPPAVTANLFSAPLISTLEKGMYYLQVGAFSKSDLVESALSRIGGAYPLAVQAGGSPEKPLYRILVGPVNLGESSALLQRFKGNGYQDAFVRRDG